MNYTVKIKTHSAKKPKMLIGRSLADKLNITKRKHGYIAFGSERSFMDIEISGEQSEQEIYLSDAIIEKLHIPLYPILEIRVKGNGIILGPVIGILANQKYEELTKRRLEEMNMSVLDYERIHGAVIVFSLDKVDQQKQLIEGYCYNPQTDSWEKGVFPYPLAIYRRASLSDEWMNHFLSVIGDTVFSNYSFDKWNMHQWFSSEPDIAGNLPSTILYKSTEDLMDMVNKYKVVYVKPVWGMKGIGVIKVEQHEDKLAFNYREDEKNIKIPVSQGTELDNLSGKLLKPGSHIIQQGLSLLKYDGGIVDFRCVMQKNEASKWVCSGIIARIGAKESIVSNISSGGAALPALELIKEAFSISETETFEVKERIIALCTKVCRTLDDYGFNYGTLGLDIGLDEEKNIWLIEVNNRRPHPAIALRANEISAYYKLLSGSLYYAKSLAGFGQQEEV